MEAPDMSETAEAEDEPEQKELKKDVNLVGYASDNSWGTIREFAEEVSGVDTTSSEKVTEVEYDLEADLGGAWDFDTTISGNYFDDQKAQEVMEELESVTDNVELIRREETKKEFENSLRDAGGSMRDDLVESLPSEILGYELDDTWGFRWMDEDGESRIKVYVGDFDSRRILSKEENRESDDLYETMSEHPSVQFSIKLTADSDEELEKMTNEVVPVLHKRLSKFSGIGKVRYMNCKVTTTKEGECYNI